jgi:hypothetical protein
MYDENAPKLIANGYHPHPIAPVGFDPPKVLVRYEPSLNRLVMYKGWASAETPLTSPQPGAGIGFRCGRGLVALDYDDDKAALEISDKIPSAVNKTGRRAFTSRRLQCSERRYL